MRKSLSYGALQIFLLTSSLLSQVLIGAKIGPGNQLDLYYSIYGYSLGLLGALSVAISYLMPAYLLPVIDDESKAKKYAFHFIISVSILLVILASSSIYIYLKLNSKILLDSIYSDYKLLLFTGWIYSIILVLNSMLTAIGVTYKKIGYPMMLSILPQIFIIFALLNGYFQNIKSLAIFQLVGISLQFIFLLIFLKQFIIVDKFRFEYVFRLLLKFPISFIGALCFSGYSVIDSFLGPLLGDKVITHEAFAQRLIIAFGSVITAGVFNISPNIINSLHADKNYRKIYFYCLKICISLIFICLISAIFINHFGLFFIAIIFQHDNFLSSDSQIVNNMFNILLIGAGPMLSVTILFRAFYSLNKYYNIIISGILWIALYWMFSFLLKDYFMQYSLSISYVITWYIILIYNIISLKNISFNINNVYEK